jgi:phage terminase small subunit
MTARDQALELLRKSNPNEKLATVTLYADAFAEYRAAQVNILEHGSVVQHPRTGQPIPNPYLTIRDNAARQLKDGIFSRLKTDALWS